MISLKIKEKIKDLKKREVLDKIITFLALPDIIVLIGMRQTGKTSLLGLIINHLLKEIPESNLFYFSLEDQVILDSFNRDQKELENYLASQKIDEKERVYIFIDEIQYLNNPTNFLKYYYDNFPNYKFVVTGSSTFQIRKKFKDSLAGRKKIVHIEPLSFKEFLYFKGKDLKIPSNIFSPITRVNISRGEILRKELEKEFLEYLLFGGYPKPTLLTERELKLEDLKDIYQSYIRRDIKDIGRIENVESYNRLIQLLASQIGNLLNVQELSNTLDLNRITLEKYLFLLENTFVIHLLKPFYQNKRKEISKMPKCFFEDVGMRNMALNDFRDLNLRVDLGTLVENFVFNELAKKLGVVDELFFWRKIAGEEVDFIWRKENEIIPLEVKFQRFKKLKIPAGLKIFLKNHSCRQAFVLTRDFRAETVFKGCRVLFWPVYLI